MLVQERLEQLAFDQNWKGDLVCDGDEPLEGELRRAGVGDDALPEDLSRYHALPVAEAAGKHLLFPLSATGKRAGLTDVDDLCVVGDRGDDIGGGLVRNLMPRDNAPDGLTTEQREGAMLGKSATEPLKRSFDGHGLSLPPFVVPGAGDYARWSLRIGCGLAFQDGPA